MAFQAPRGTEDLLPEETRNWRKVEAIFHSICSRYHYGEIRTPLFEQTDLFIRGVGDSTDIVNKEMYTFQDRGGRSITLRPEGTAPVVRAYVEHKLFGDGSNAPVKLYYMGPMFRYERPQAGRQRQFHQFGVEAIGVHDPSLDAEVISLAWNFFRELGLTGIRLEINSVGCPVCRPAYRKALVDSLAPHKERLCEDCQIRLEKNPLRILDCKVDGEKEVVKEAPVMVDHLCKDCSEHFNALKEMLNALEIPYVVNPRLVRGLDYYTRTAFEFKEGKEGEEDTICGGGRYNGLVKEIGGPDEPGIGFGLGVERLLLALRNQGIQLGSSENPSFYLVAMEDGLRLEKTKLLHRLRKAGFTVETDFLNRKMKGQLKAADRSGARFALILGGEEFQKGLFLLKDLRSGVQEAFSLAKIELVLKAALAKDALPETGDAS